MHDDLILSNVSVLTLTESENHFWCFNLSFTSGKLRHKVLKTELELTSAQQQRETEDGKKIPNRDVHNHMNPHSYCAWQNMNVIIKGVNSAGAFGWCVASVICLALVERVWNGRSVYVCVILGFTFTGLLSGDITLCVSSWHVKGIKI